MFLVSSCLIIVTLVVIAYKLFCRQNPEGCPPGPGFIPILGSIPYLPKEFRSKRGLHIPKLFQYLSKMYGKVSCIHLGPIRTIVISDVKILREAFKLEQLSSRPTMRPFHELRYGSPDGSQRGMFFSSGQEWSEQRKFSMWQLKDLGFGKSAMEDLMLEESAKMCSMLQMELENVSENENGEKLIDLSLRMNISAVNGLWVLLVGEKLELTDPKLTKIVQAIDGVLRRAQIASLFAILFPNVFKHFKRFAGAKEATEGVRSLFKPLIEQKLAAIRNESPDDVGKRSFCFMDAYIAEIERVTARNDTESSFYGTRGIESLECVLLDMFMGGSETTATSIMWAIAYLIHQPEIQAKVHAELDNVVGRQNQPRLEHCGQLHYVNAVLTETMRMASVAPSGLPHYVTEDVWISGYLFPKNTNVMASISSIHYNPENWPEPERFNPDRFLDETGKFVAPKSGFVPFSVGKRFCLGQSLAEKEFFLFFAGLMQKFEFRAPKSGSLPNIVFQDDDENIGFVRQPDKYLVDVKLRN